ncbi:MAG TPA: septal ring lytic transglycosylase RlpA family protein [Acetobacteraceae bacterium]|nr:septal ring lytic transglycosylase RlpA family protein [Acetobacteraceae bacterium]
MPARLGLCRIAAIGLAAGLSACSSAAAVHPVAAVPPPPAPVSTQHADASRPVLRPVGATATGVASWYRTGRGLYRTCTGVRLQDDALTAASPSLPMGTRVRVSLVHGSQSVVAMVNDCMPRGRRIIDLSMGAARALGMIRSGVAEVRVTPVARIAPALVRQADAQ